MKKRRVCSREFKLGAVHLTRQAGVSVAGVVRGLGADANTLTKWQGEDQQRGEQVFPGQGHSHDEELARLGRENALLRQERDILKRQSTTM